MGGAAAERRRIEAHPRTGTIQIVETREEVEEIEAPPLTTPEIDQAAARQALFAGLTLDALLDLGVPTDWIETVRSATEDNFLDIADHLPPEAAEALLEYAATGLLPVALAAAPPTVMAQRAHEPEPERQLDFAASPDTERRFRVVENVAELEAALAWPWERWTVFLHAAQRQVVERSFSGSARVAGSAGTGKTVVALHRAARLAEKHPDARVLLTTFSRPLANALERKLRILVGEQSSVIPRITVAPFRGIAEELYQLAFGRRPQIASDEQTGRSLAEAASAEGSTEFSPRFLVSEWTNVVDAWQIDSLDGYAGKGSCCRSLSASC